MDTLIDRGTTPDLTPAQLKTIQANTRTARWLLLLFLMAIVQPQASAGFTTSPPSKPWRNIQVPIAKKDDAAWEPPIPRKPAMVRDSIAPQQKVSVGWAWEAESEWIDLELTPAQTALLNEYIKMSIESIFDNNPWLREQREKEISKRTPGCSLGYFVYPATDGSNTGPSVPWGFDGDEFKTEPTSTEIETMTHMGMSDPKSLTTLFGPALNWQILTLDGATGWFANFAARRASNGSAGEHIGIVTIPSNITLLLYGQPVSAAALQWSTLDPMLDPDETSGYGGIIVTTLPQPSLIIHEIGHLFWLTHSAGPHYMNPVPGNNDSFSPPDRLKLSDTANVLWPDNNGLAYTSNACEDSDILPVEITRFSGLYNPNEKTVDLHWETASEHNNAGFSIMRSRDGGKTWQEICTVAAESPNSTKIQTYACTDSDPSPWDNLYRLEQEDLNGSKTASKIIRVQTPKGNKPWLKNNLVEPGWDLHLENMPEGSTYCFTTMIGQAVSQTDRSDAGNGPIQAPHDPWIYVITIQTGNGEFVSERFVVQ